MRSTITIFFSILLQGTTIQAQDKAAILRDTFTTIQREQLKDNTIPNSFSAHNQMMRSVHGKDSTEAERLLQKIDPHYLFFLQHTPENIDSILIKNNIRYAVRKDYVTRFKNLYNNRSEVYRQLETMYSEDVQVRKLLDKCGDSFTCETARRKMITSDSVHFDFLRRYVKKEGFPNMANGSLFATLIAIHDHGHHITYLPMIKKAVLNGATNIQAYDLIHYWLNSSKSITELKQYLDTVKKKTFDASFILKGIDYPKNMSAIRKAIPDYHKVTIYYILHVKTSKAFDKLTDFLHQQNHDGVGVISKFQQELCHDCKNENDTYPWAVTWFKSESTTPRLMMHIVPKEK